MKKITYAKIRKDILSDGLAVPVGDFFYDSIRSLECRWNKKGEFKVKIKNKWEKAESTDFEFSYFIKLTEEEFDEKFKLVLNHFYENPEDCSFNGCMFETYDEEIEYVHKCYADKETRNKVWTIIEGDDDTLYYVSGFHIVNRLGFLITEQSVEENTEYEVELDTIPSIY